MNRIRVLLVDDRGLVRAAFHSLLERMEGVEVVGEAQTGEQGLRLVADQAPDLVFLDIGLPGMNGLEVLSRITSDYPHVRVVMLSMHPDEEYVLAAIRNGAKGYLVKEGESGELDECLRAVMQGQTYLSPSVSHHVLEDYVRRVRDDSAPAKAAKKAPAELLTERQLKVLLLIAKGYTTFEIARELGLSSKTIETHRTNLMSRLDIHDIPGLVRYAIRTGLISADIGK